MYTVLNRAKNRVSNGAKEELSAMVNDRIFLAFFVIMVIKNSLFLKLLTSPGASQLEFSIKWFDITGLLMAVLFTALLLNFYFLFKRSINYLFAVNLIFSVILVGDLIYFRSFNTFLSFHMISETANLTNMSSGVLSLLRPIDIIFFTDNILLIAIVLIQRKNVKRIDNSRGPFIYIFSAVIGILLMAHLIFDVAAKEAGLFKMQWMPYVTMRSLSALGFHTFDTYMYVCDQIPYQLMEHDKQDIDSWLEYKNDNLLSNQYKDIFQGKNLIVIQVESLEKFVINNVYEGQEITPNINRLLTNSLYFSRFYEQVHQGNSSDADLMSNASVYPVRRGSTFFRFPNNAYNTMPKLLKTKGYTAKAFHADYGYYWNVNQALLRFGFDEFKDVDAFANKEVYWMGLTDESFLTQIKDELITTRNPFYAFAVTTTSHSPFKLPAEFKALTFKEEFDATYMGGYFQSVNYADRQIGKFIDSLDNEGMLENTVIVIYGDHAGVHKYYADEVAKIEPQEEWWKGDHEVPLIIYSKGLKSEEIKTIGGQIDIMPTLAYTLGIDSKLYQNTTVGRNLLNTSRSFALLADGRIITDSNLTEIDKKFIEQSFEKSDMIIKSNYFADK